MARTLLLLSILFFMDHAQSQIIPASNRDILECTFEEVRKCSITIADMKNVLNEFEILKEESQPEVVRFTIKGITINMSNDSTNTTFDPYIWAWTTPSGQYILDMPVDMDILSLYLLMLKMYDMDIEIKTSPPGCESQISNKCIYNWIAQSLMRFNSVYNEEPEKHKNDICRTTYNHPDFLGYDIIGIGGDTCCKRPYKNATIVCERHKFNDKFGMRLALFIVGILLPAFAVLLIFMWPGFTIRKLTRGVAIHMTNKLKRVYLIDLKHKAKLRPSLSEKIPRLSNKQLLLDRGDLISYRGGVSIFGIYGRFVLLPMEKIKLSLLLLTEFFVMIIWLGLYSSKAEVIQKMKSGKVVAFNLRNNPFSWVYSNKNLWTYHFGIALVAVNCLTVVFVIIWWLTEIKAFRLCILKIFVFCFKKKDKELNEKHTQILTEWLIKGNLAIVSLSGFIVLYALFHSLIYTLSGLVLNIEIVSPWLTGIVIAVFQVNLGFSRLTTMYTKIKRYMFESYLQLENTYSGEINQELHIQEINYKKKSITDKEDRTYRYKKAKCDKNIIFSDTRDGKYHVYAMREMFTDICKKYAPVGKNAKKAIIRTTAMLLFLFLVVLTVSYFPIGGSDKSNVLVTAVVTLLSALLPEVTGFFTNDEVQDMNQSVLERNIGLTVADWKPKIRVVKMSSKIFRRPKSKPFDYEITTLFSGERYIGQKSVSASDISEYDTSTCSTPAAISTVSRTPSGASDKRVMFRLRSVQEHSASLSSTSDSESDTDSIQSLLISDDEEEKWTEKPKLIKSNEKIRELSVKYLRDNVTVDLRHDTVVSDIPLVEIGPKQINRQFSSDPSVGSKKDDEITPDDIKIDVNDKETKQRKISAHSMGFTPQTPLLEQESNETSKGTDKTTL